MSPILAELDPEFLPAALWRRDFRKDAKSQQGPEVTFAIGDLEGNFTHFTTRVLPENEANFPRNFKFLERTLKFLLWQRGGNRVFIAGAAQTTAAVIEHYRPFGQRGFDSHFIGRRVYGAPLEILASDYSTLPLAIDPRIEMTADFSGCRIGFDLGGSDRKCAAIIDGEVVYSEEVGWDPYFQTDPEYHISGIQASLESAAKHLPRVDAIGGSAAGIYIDNEVRAGSLFRGINEEVFQAKIRRLFVELGQRWGVPLRVANDGEVSALAGSLWTQKNALLGLSLGTSTAAGYVTRDGRITRYLNELAFVPIDHRDNSPRDEWSGDCGCSVSYLSQQAIARLIPASGLSIPASDSLPKQLEAVQVAMLNGHPDAKKIYRTIGTYLGYALVSFKEFLDFESVMLLGRVTSGKGGDLMIQAAGKVLDQFPEYKNKIQVLTPDETEKRHGQAIAAAALPRL